MLEVGGSVGAVGEEPHRRCGVRSGDCKPRAEVHSPVVDLHNLAVDLHNPAVDPDGLRPTAGGFVSGRSDTDEGHTTTR